MKYINILISSIVLFTLLIGCNKNIDQNDKEIVSLTISAAASLNESLSEIKDQFEKEHTNIELVLNFGGSGSLQQQIKQGAPVDLFFSAAKDNFTELIEKGFIDKEKQDDIVGNNLVLIILKERTLESIDELTQGEIRKVAIGTPESVPAGRYAKQTIESFNLWNSLEPKLVMSKDVRQVLTYVETGNVDAGFVYNTDAMQSDKVDVVEKFSKNHHSPILYPAGIVKTSKHYDEAVVFYDYLKSDSARKIFEKHGFTHGNDNNE